MSNNLVHVLMCIACLFSGKLAPVVEHLLSTSTAEACVCREEFRLCVNVYRLTVSGKVPPVVGHLLSTSTAEACVRENSVYVLMCIA